MIWSRRGADELGALLGSFNAVSWRWECRGDYSAIDAALLQRWRDGLGRDPEIDKPWVDYVRDLRRRGIRFERARLLADPVPEYQRCILDFTYMNVDAGEDIRWLPHAVAEHVGAPTHDFYLFDDTRVVVLDFDEVGLLSGLRSTTDVETVSQHRCWRDLIWAHAEPHDQLRAHRKVP